MTPAGRLHASLRAVGWSMRHLAGVLRIDPKQVRRWSDGIYEPPESVLAWLERLAAYHERNPPP